MNDGNIPEQASDSKELEQLTDEDVRKAIYDLKLHEESRDNGMAILRVPGGWLYSFWDYVNKEDSNRVFVPYNNEFQAHEQSKR